MVMSFLSLVVAILGIYVYQSKNVNFIAGYNEKRFKGSEKEFAEKTGVFCVCIAFLLFLIPFAELINNIFVCLLVSIMLVVCLAFFWYMNKLHG